MTVSRRENKRAHRKVRSALKAKIARGSQFESSVLSRYSLNAYGYKRERNKTKQELIAALFDSECPPIEIKVPKVFCFIQDSKKTLEFLESLDSILVGEATRNIFISHEDTEYIGLSASYIFDTRIKELRDHWRRKNIKMRLWGRVSNSKEVNNFLAAFGIFKELGIDTKKINNLDWSYETKFKSFKRIHSKGNPVLKSNAATELTKYFDDCLRHVGGELTDEGVTYLVDSIGELLGNAEEHSGVDKNWKILGCFEKATRHVKFAIVNSGLSIYETLASNESTSRDVLTRIEKVLIDQRSFLTRTKDLAMRVSEEEIIEPIWNVMALQEGISSKRTEDSEGRTRGKGMMDVLDFISEIHQHHEDACIVIISGHSRILIDYEYPILRKKVVVDHENGPKTELWRAISFNKEGSLHLPQDPNKVGYIKSKFDGTIITGRFKLSDKYVKQIENLED